MIGLVSCSAQKLDHAARARELYCSPLFRKSLAYAERHCDHVYVLSARHHLVELDQVLEPYEQRLATRKSDRELWGRIAAGSLEAKHGRARHDLFVLAGNDYVQPLLRAVTFWWRDSSWRKHVHLPLAGLQVGQRLRWLNEQLALCGAPSGPSRCILDAGHETHHSDGWRTWRAAGAGRRSKPPWRQAIVIDQFNEDGTGRARFSDDMTMRFRLARSLNSKPIARMLCALEPALEGLDPHDATARRAKYNDQRRTSLNNIEEATIAYAAKLRRLEAERGD